MSKTTLTPNLGAALAHLGQRVLPVDQDPQGHLTEGIGLGEAYLTEQLTLYTALVSTDQTVSIDQLLHQPPTEPFAVLPSSYQLMLAEQALYLARNREHKLAGLLAQLDGRFDWVFINCPPVLGNLTDNALTAAWAVVIPIQAEATSVRALELLFDQIESVERGLTITVQVLAVVPTLVQDSALAKRILTELRQALPGLTPFELRKQVLRQAAWGAGRPIFGYPPTSPTPPPRPARRSPLYAQLARLVMARAVQEEGLLRAEGRGDRIDKLSSGSTGTSPAGPPQPCPGAGSGAASTSTASSPTASMPPTGRWPTSCTRRPCPNQCS